MAEHCNEHCLVQDHMSDGKSVRDQVVTNTTKLKNYDTWVPKIEKKVDSLLWKVVASVGGINIISIIAAYLLMKN